MVESKLSRVEREVRKLLTEAGVKAPPVPVKKLARMQGAKVRFEPYEDDDQGLSGILFREGDKKIIGVNSLHAPVRQRFTIAHEIGHLVLHDEDLFVDGAAYTISRDRKSSRAIDQKEIDANQFAACLLMPKGFLAQRLEKGKAVALSKLYELAEEFRVSAEAMTFRLTNLNYAIDQTR